MTALAIAVANLMSVPALAGTPTGPHPRFLLGTSRSALAERADDPDVAALIRRCDEGADSTVGAGYQGHEWVRQMTACAIAWYATGTHYYGVQAVKYWRALLDDRLEIGDGRGGITGYNGQPVVARDNGYAMRTFGVYGALGLDWLYHAPGVNDALRAHARERLLAWHDWYVAEGYLPDQANSNYFAGYFFATWAAAFAIGTDDESGAELFAAANELVDDVVRPAMSQGLQGGDFAEGWQYGELSIQSMLLVNAAIEDVGLKGFAGDLAFETVLFHIFGTHPDGTTFFNSADQEVQPVQAGSDAVWGALVSSPRAPWARWAELYVSGIGGPGIQPWVRALAKARIPAWSLADWSNGGLPSSYFASGTSVVLARSGWGPDDVWVSFRAAGRLAPDHQHCDAGHFDIVRGSDPLAVTRADYGTWASMSNNTLLFEDGGRNNLLSPNQTPWADPATVRVTRVGDVGSAVAASADLSDAYEGPDGESSVSQARRDWVFFRPDLVIVSDRGIVDDPSVVSRFVLHTTVIPTVTGSRLVADVGASRLTSDTLLPSGAARVTIHEPDPAAGPAPWRNNDPLGASFRADESITGTTEVAFLHVLTAGARGTDAPHASVAVEDGARVVTIPASSSGSPERIVVLPDDAAGGDLALPLSYTVARAGSQDHVVFGLPGDEFSLAVAADDGACQITLTAGTDESVTAADGTAGFHLDGCAIGTPPAAPPPITPPGDEDPDSPGADGEGEGSGCGCQNGDGGLAQGGAAVALAILVGLGISPFPRSSSARRRRRRGAAGVRCLSGPVPGARTRSRW